jgi:hypothetical protein
VRADTDVSIRAGWEQVTPTPRSRFRLVQTVRADIDISILAGSDSSSWHDQVDSGWFRQFELAPTSRFRLVQTARADTDTSAEGGSDSPIWDFGIGVTMCQTARADLTMSARTV